MRWLSSPWVAREGGCIFLFLEWSGNGRLWSPITLMGYGGRRQGHGISPCPLAHFLPTVLPLCFGFLLWCVFGAVGYLTPVLEYPTEVLAPMLLIPGSR